MARPASVLLSVCFYLFLYVLCSFCAFLCFCVHCVFWCVLCVWAKLPEIKLDDDDDCIRPYIGGPKIGGAGAQPIGLGDVIDQEKYPVPIQITVQIWSLWP